MCKVTGMVRESCILRCAGSFPEVRSPPCRPRGIIAAPWEVAMISTDSVGSFVFLAELMVHGQARYLGCLTLSLDEASVVSGLRFRWGGKRGDDLPCESCESYTLLYSLILSYTLLWLKPGGGFSAPLSYFRPLKLAGGSTSSPKGKPLRSPPEAIRTPFLHVTRGDRTPSDACRAQRTERERSSAALKGP